MGSPSPADQEDLISVETVLSPLLADLRSPPGFSLSTYCFQNSFLLRDVSRLCPLLRSALLPRALISCSLPLHEGFWNAEDSLAGARQPDALESLAFVMPLRLLPIPSASPSPHFRDHQFNRFAQAPALPLDSLGPRPHLRNIGL
jgi:hypothetical protein